MPELPEVETIRRDLIKLVVGKKVLDIKTDSPKQVKPSLAIVKKAIVGASIKKIERRAKLLQIFFSNNRVLIIHLKLTGRLLVREAGAVEDKWQHVVLFLSGNKELRFTDLRKFGWVKLLKDQNELEEILSGFGPEPLNDLDFNKFKEILASTARAIKVLLMDQKKISGIGNIYACDALLLAKIHPEKKAKELKEVEAKRLFTAVEKVLKAGIKYRGASDQYYLDALGHKGSYQDHFLAYGRAGEKCFKCDGIIDKMKLGGRGTYFCPKCQKK